MIFFVETQTWYKGFPGGSVVKDLPANVGATGDTSSIPGLESFCRGANSNPLQYSCRDNPMDRAAWRTVSMGWQSRTRLSEQEVT